MWDRLAYAHVSAKTLERIRWLIADEDIRSIEDKVAMRAMRMHWSFADYRQEVMDLVDDYANTMLYFANLTKSAAEKNRFMIAYYAALKYLEKRGIV